MEPSEKLSSTSSTSSSQAVQPCSVDGAKRRQIEHNFTANNDETTVEIQTEHGAMDVDDTRVDGQEVEEGEAVEINAIEDTKPLEAFTCFPRLPPEIRVYIWELAKPGPRNVILRFREVKGTFRAGTIWVAESRTPIPTLLHTTSESREEMKKSYQLSFAGRNSHKVADACQRGPRVYFDFERDALCWKSTGRQPEQPPPLCIPLLNPWLLLPSKSFILSILGPDRSKVRHLVLLDNICLLRRPAFSAQVVYCREIYDALEHASYVVCPFDEVPRDFKIDENPDFGVYRNQVINIFFPNQLQQNHHLPLSIQQNRHLPLSITKIATIQGSDFVDELDARAKEVLGGDRKSHVELQRELQQSLANRRACRLRYIRQVTYAGIILALITGLACLYVLYRLYPELFQLPRFLRISRLP